MKYQEGMGQAGALNSGVTGGLGYLAPSRKWKALSHFGHGFQARRPNGDGHGGYTLGLAFEYTFGSTKTAGYEAWEQLDDKHNAHGATLH